MKTLGGTNAIARTQARSQQSARLVKDPKRSNATSRTDTMADVDFAPTENVAAAGKVRRRRRRG